MPRKPRVVGGWALAIGISLSLGCRPDRGAGLQQKGRAAGADPPRSTARAVQARIEPTITVVADVSLGPQEEAAVLARVKAAFAFALGACGWSAPEMIAAAPLELHITALPRGTAARTSGSGEFSVASDALRRADADGVLAHELTHLQDFRAARGGLRSIPRYLAEGRALSIGREFRRSLGICGTDDERVDAIATLTSEQATEALAGFRDGSGLRLARRSGVVFRWMSVSVFFVEFLRTRAHGTGWPDAVKRLSRVWERVGRGDGFADAFTGEFSQSLESLEQEFVRFVASTEGDRSARLGGTAYEATVGPPACAAATSR